MDKVLHWAYKRFCVYPIIGATFQSGWPSLQIRKDMKKTLGAQGCISLFALLIVTACVWKAGQLRSSDSHGLYFLSLGNHLCKSSAQNAVAMQMGVVAEDYEVKFIISLGNNFDNRSFFNITDPNITVISEDLLAFHSSLCIPWYMATEDYNSGPDSLESQIAFPNSSDYLVMPALYFTRKILLPSGGSIDLIFLHTKTLLYDQVQVQWLKRILANSSAEWCMIIGYHPLQNQLRNLLQPIFLQYGVDAYLYGSSHVGEYYEDGSVVYIGNGVGGCSQGASKSQDQALWTRHEYNGFILHHVSSVEMEFKFIDMMGNILQGIIIKAKRKVEIVSFTCSLQVTGFQ